MISFHGFCTQIEAEIRHGEGKDILQAGFASQSGGFSWVFQVKLRMRDLRFRIRSASRRRRSFREQSGQYFAAFAA
jgi:hypothetical protein